MGSKDIDCSGPSHGILACWMKVQFSSQASLKTQEFVSS